MCVSLGGSLRPAVRMADDITRRKPVNTPVVVTSNQDQATCNRTLTPR
jgi:hypothetical protein